jgi:multiple sugar transport system substrate-binding protein
MSSSPPLCVCGRACRTTFRVDRRQLLHLLGLGSATSLLGACDIFTPVAPTPTPRPLIAQNRPTAVPFQPASGPVTLRVVNAMFGYSGGQQVFEGILAGYREQNPNVTLDVEYLPDSRAVADRVNADLAAGNPPDVFIIGSEWFAGFNAQNAVVNIEFQIRAGELGDFILALQQNASWLGHLYGLPLRAASSVLLYRKDHFAEIGLDATKLPASWEELADAAVKLTRRNPDGSLSRAGFDIVGGATSAADQPRQHFFPFYWQNGAQLFNGPNTGPQPAFNSPEGVEALDWWLGLVRDKRVIDFGFSTGRPDTSLIVAGTAAMGSYPDSVWVEIQRNPDAASQIGVLPSLRRKDNGEFVRGDLIGITRGSKYTGTAWSLVEYLTSQDGMLRVDMPLSALPARKSLVVSDYVKASPVLTGASRQLAIAKSEGGPVQWPQIRDLWDQALIDALRGQRPARDVLDDLSRQASDLLKA